MIKKTVATTREKCGQNLTRPFGPPAHLSSFYYPMAQGELKRQVCSK
jgi:hypothetical protein